MKKLLVGLLMLAVLVPVVFMGLMLFSFNGGIQGIKNALRPEADPASTEIREKRAASRTFIDDERKMFEKSNPGLAHLADSQSDGCHRGEASWKRTDNFSNKCDQKIIRFYGTNEDIRNQIVRFGEFFAANGWHDPYKTTSGEEVAQALSRYDENGYLVGIRAEKDDVIMMVDPAEMNENGNYFVNQFAYWGVPYYKNDNFQDINALYTDAFARYKYVVAVSFEGVYFQN